MEKTIVEQVLQAPEHSFVERPVDLLMGHDGTASLVVDAFTQSGKKPWDPEKVMIVFDHFAPAASIERANIQNSLLRFTEQNQLPFALHQGICHQLLLEDPRVLPGSLVIGADSHTTTAGAQGALATGVGATDFLNTLLTGNIWLRVPTTIRVEFIGGVPAYIQGKDLILYLLSLLGADGALYRCLEFQDYTEDGLDMDARAAICNMAVDLGAKFGFFVPDEITKISVRSKTGKWEDINVPRSRKFEKHITVKVDEIEPLLSNPSGEVEKVASHSGQPVSQVFMGSCTAGRISDLRSIAKVLQERKTNPAVKTIVIPGSQQVYLKAMEDGYIQTIANSGSIISNPSCGPCCNIDKGVAGDNDICLSTSNRNYPGRMGSLSSQVYLASSLTAAATAVRGKITDPREYI